MSQNAEACVVIRKLVYICVLHYYFKVRSYICAHLSVITTLQTKQHSIFYYPIFADEKSDTKECSNVPKFRQYKATWDQIYYNNCKSLPE